MKKLLHLRQLVVAAAGHFQHVLFASVVVSPMTSKALTGQGDWLYRALRSELHPHPNVPQSVALNVLIAKILIIIRPVYRSNLPP